MANPPTQGFEEIQSFRNADGLLVVVTTNLRTSQLSMALFKVFERNGTEERTPWIQLGQITSAQDLLATARTWCQAYLEKNPPPEPNRRQYPASNGAHHGAGRHGGRR